MQRIGHHRAAAILRAFYDLTRIGLGDRQIPIVIVEDIRSREWASITFAGLRHEFDLRLEGECSDVSAALRHLADYLGETDMPMAGHFLAEIAVVQDADAVAIAYSAPGHHAQRLRIEALTIRD